MDTIQYETCYGTCSAVNIKDLPELLRYKLSVQHILDKEFKRLPMETQDPITVGKSREVKKKNRFKNIVPYDNNRVILSTINGIAFSDYINASIIKGYSDAHQFIATQGPTNNTVGDFWRMIYEKDVGVIVMVTELVENDKAKCAKYWPDIGEHLSHGDITETTIEEDIQDGYTRRTFQVSKDSEVSQVTQWHFLNYPDHGVPDDANKFLTFLRKVRKSMSPGRSTVVHCSAGAGRTGTFIAIDYLLEQGKAEGQVDIFRCFQHLRQQRPHMIQNLEQYKFIHNALLCEYTIGNTTMPCSSFSSALKNLKENETNDGPNQFEVQFQILEEMKQPSTKEKKSRVLSKILEKNKVAEMEATFIQGWKQAKAYMSVAPPMAKGIEDFYSLLKEFNCRCCIFLDEEQDEAERIFPTKEKDITLRSSTLACSSVKETRYGTCYKVGLTDRNHIEGAYENVVVYENTKNASNAMELTVLHVNASGYTDCIEPSVQISLYNDAKSLRTSRTDNPTVIISRIGYSASAFCLASFIAFEMAKDEQEVDVYQTVKNIRQSMPHFHFTLLWYERLHEVVDEFIKSSPAETSSPEPVYELGQHLGDVEGPVILQQRNTTSYFDEL